jgi:hypothetical protein
MSTRGEQKPERIQSTWNFFLQAFANATDLKDGSYSLMQSDA